MKEIKPGEYAPAEKARSIKKVTILGQIISEDLLKKMNFAEPRKFCVGVEAELKKFVQSPALYSRFPLTEPSIEPRIAPRSWTAKSASCCTTSQVSSDSDTWFDSKPHRVEIGPQ